MMRAIKLFEPFFPTIRTCCPFDAWDSVIPVTPLATKEYTVAFEVFTKVFSVPGPRSTKVVPAFSESLPSSTVSPDSGSG